MLTISAERPILDVWQSSEHAFDVYDNFLTNQ